MGCVGLSFVLGPSTMDILVDRAGSQPSWLSCPASWGTCQPAGGGTGSQRVGCRACGGLRLVPAHWWEEPGPQGLVLQLWEGPGAATSPLAGGTASWGDWLWGPRELRLVPAYW